MDIYSIEFLQGSHGGIDTVDSCMSELVARLAGDAGDWNEVITRCCCEQDLVCPGVYRHHNIDITSARCIDRAAHINAADQNGVGILCKGNVFGSCSFSLCIRIWVNSGVTCTAVNIFEIVGVDFCLKSLLINNSGLG